MVGNRGGTAGDVGDRVLKGRDQVGARRPDDWRLGKLIVAWHAVDAIYDENLHRDVLRS